MNQYSTYSAVYAKTSVNSFIQGVYMWMAGALAVTGIVCYLIGTNMTLLAAFVNIVQENGSYYVSGLSPVWWVCAIATFVMVFYFSSRLNRISAGTATIIFILYSALSGATFAPIFLIYTHTSITSVFFICAATFGVCSVFGFVTKRDLTGVGQFCMMGLIGIIIASVVNLVLFRSYGLHMIIGYVGVIVFVGLTAYDTQKMKNMALSMPDDVDGAVVRKATLNSALALYLDFINLFLMLLRIMGSRN